VTTNSEQLLGQLHKLVADLETLAKSSASVAEERGAEAAEQFKGALAGARERIEDVEQSLERKLRKHGKVVDGYVRDNPWGAVAIAAAVAFLLGALSRRRD
jgi:ElaB/YqjD/DUF883 family membrane-anchored ribosome-binding protein